MKYGDIQTIPSRTDIFDPGSLQVLQIELYKQESDREPVKLSVKAPDEMQFGTWFHRMIDDYNLKSPQAPIDDYAAKREDGFSTGSPPCCLPGIT